MNLAQLIPTTSATPSPAEVERRRRLAQQLAGGGVQNAGPLGALSQALAGTVSGYEDRQASEMETAGRQAASEALARALSDPNAGIDVLAQAAIDPFTTDRQGAIAQALIGQQIEQKDPMYQAQLAQLQGRGGTEAENFFGTGVPIQNADGTISYGQFGNQGGFNIPELPEGSQFLTPVQQLNTGTGFTGVDRFGNPTGEVTPIDNFTPAQDAALGKVIGEEAASRILELPQKLAVSDNMIASIDGVLNDPALDNSTGWLSWMQAVPGTEQYRFGQRALQLQGQAFLQAFTSLKGGGTITEIEGLKAEQAIGRLSTAQNPADYRQALTELKGIIGAAKARTVNSAEQIQLPGSSAIQPSAVPQGGGSVRTTPNGIEYSF